MTPDFRARLAGLFGLRSVSRASSVFAHDGHMGAVIRTIAVLVALTYVVIFLVISVLFIIEVVQMLQAKWLGTTRSGTELTKELGFLFVAMISGPFVAWRTLSASTQAVTAEQRHITERLMHAAEQIWATRRIPMVKMFGETWMSVEDECPNIEARIAGLRELERVSEYSEADHIPAMETICSYLRLNASRDLPEPDTDVASKNAAVKRFNPRLDIVVAVQILGRRSLPRRELEKANKFWLDVSYTRLRQIDLAAVNMARASLSTVDFTEAYLANADLSMAWLHGSVFDRTVMRGCCLEGAALPDCDLRNAIDLDSRQLAKAFGVKFGEKKTLLPDGVSPPGRWHEPSKTDLPLSEFFQEFDAAYARFCRDEGLDFIPSS